MHRNLEVLIVIGVDVMVDGFGGVGQMEVVNVLGDPVQEGRVSGHSLGKMSSSSFLRVLTWSSAGCCRL